MERSSCGYLCETSTRSSQLNSLTLKGVFWQLIVARCRKVTFLGAYGQLTAYIPVDAQMGRSNWTRCIILKNKIKRKWNWGDDMCCDWDEGGMGDGYDEDTLFKNFKEWIKIKQS